MDEVQDKAYKIGKSLKCGTRRFVRHGPIVPPEDWPDEKVVHIRSWPGADGQQHEERVEAK